MKGKAIDESDEAFRRPGAEDLRETTETTRKALEKIISTKVFIFLIILRMFCIL